MNVKKLNKIHEEFRQEFDLFDEKKLTYTVIESEILSNSPIWTAEYFDNKYDLFKNKFKTFIELKNIAKIEKGIEPGSKVYIDFFDKNIDDIPFIKTSELANYEVNFTCKQYVDKNFWQKNKQDVRIKDILFTKDGKVGQVAIINGCSDFIFGSGLVKIRLKNKNIFTPEFIFMLLTLKEFGLYFCKKYAVRGTTIPHLNIDYLKNMQIPVFDKKIIEKYTNKLLNIINYEK